MQPYAITHRVTAADGNTFYPVTFPNRYLLTRVTCIGPASSTFDLTFYNRNVSPAAVDLSQIIDNGQGKCRLQAAQPLALVGDKLTVASSTVAGYNTTHIVTRTGQNYADTDQAFTSRGFGGTATLTLSSKEAELYQICDKFAASSSGVIRTAFPDNLVSMNLDPVDSLLPQAKLYAKFSVAGAYILMLVGYKEVDSA